MRHQNLVMKYLQRNGNLVNYSLYGDHLGNRDVIYDGNACSNYWVDKENVRNYTVQY